MSKNFNIYFSYSWFYGDNYKRVIGLLKSKHYFGFQEYYVPVDDPANQNPKSPELYGLIQSQMNPCHVVLLLGGAYAHFCDWIEKEVKIAKEEFEKPKPIIVIIPPRPVKLAFFVQENADVIINWSSEILVYNIKKMSL